MNEKNILLAARVVSLLFTPYYLPVVGLIALFTFSYLSMLPRGYQLTMLLIVYLSTVLFPTLLLHAYRQYTGWSPIQFGHKERRVVPYVISILCYFLCYYLMLVAHVPHVINSIVVAALAIQIICALINIGWGVSSHTAAIGGVTGGLLAFSLIFNFNPVWWPSCGHSGYQPYDPAPAYPRASPCRLLLGARHSLLHHPPCLIPLSSLVSCRKVAVRPIFSPF